MPISYEIDGEAGIAVVTIRGIVTAQEQREHVTRLLADAMDAHSILERLFDRQLASRSFPEAEGIIWLAEFQASSSAGDSTRSLAVYSSVHWLDEMEKISEFESSAYEDETRETGES